jgi:hypothetical protein
VRLRHVLVLERGKWKGIGIGIVLGGRGCHHEWKGQWAAGKQHVKNRGKGDERGENEFEAGKMEGKKANAGRLWYVGGLLVPVGWT